LAAFEYAEVGRVDIVDDNVGILTVKCVYGFDADSPEVAAEAEFFLDAEVEAGKVREAEGVGKADELLLKIDDAKGKAGAVLEEVAELNSPDVSGSPAPGEEAVGDVPGNGRGLLRGEKNGPEGGVEDFIGVGDGACVGAVDFHVLREYLAQGNGG